MNPTDSFLYTASMREDEDYDRWQEQQINEIVEWYEYGGYRCTEARAAFILKKLEYTIEDIRERFNN